MIKEILFSNVTVKVYIAIGPALFRCKPVKLQDNDVVWESKLGTTW